jgi:hypothetical protein
MANQKDIRILKIWNKGERSLGAIARKIGYGGAMEAGVERVKEGLQRLGLLPLDET